MRRVPSLMMFVCTAGVLATGLLAAPATFASASQVVADCNGQGHLTRHYSTSDLRNALSTMPADVKEYTDCYDVIQRALLAQIGSAHAGGGGSSGQSSGGSFLPTPLIVVLVLLALAGATLGAVAIRRRGSAGGTPDSSSGS